MNKAFFSTIKWVAAVYSIGYIIFDYPNDTYTMRAITGIMTTIFSFNVLIYLFKRKGIVKKGTVKPDVYTKVNDELNNELWKFLNEGNDIKAVKRVREALGLSLIEAKQYIDALKLKGE